MLVVILSLELLCKGSVFLNGRLGFQSQRKLLAFKQLPTYVVESPHN